MMMIVSGFIVWHHCVAASHIKRDVDLMRNGMNLFAWQKPVQLNAEDSRQLASLVAVMTSELGYKGTKETLKGPRAWLYFPTTVGRLGFGGNMLETVAESPL